MVRAPKVSSDTSEGDSNPISVKTPRSIAAQNAGRYGRGLEGIVKSQCRWKPPLSVCGNNEAEA